MNQFSDKSCAEILVASVMIDKACRNLNELPESIRLARIIDMLSVVTAELDAILKDEEF